MLCFEIHVNNFLANEKSITNVLFLNLLFTWSHRKKCESLLEMHDIMSYRYSEQLTSLFKLTLDDVTRINYKFRMYNVYKRYLLQSVIEHCYEQFFRN